ncbi:MAG: DUF2169 domain-containing protein [Mesorhizobium sp.]|uniref:DUF2169 family type VI secretion system accessory protein n=1 Tax=unclassified Mesorhizobium TaxID=325217 RepID=UPI000FCB6F30|nr:MULTISPECIES: DUF2169 domain-containing protein [unclassified Mesorhizobium]RUV71951.1 DUF2169 domain-containing protein [Mesorhizobium sp. M5C.F.Cr.IN.023.01.1.1]RWF82283.1 MAG: DUF2169 domain-containing protein [Mesorhizobium sp.]RWF95778.1 MAG: DUF2169 domain-containing protein [Mesorhizobium sp.]RWI38139.1 MAG: DUF2169 domain-containing protein [Mesorhizobium sp.]RWI46123.1 MAG: DUF2169 domain-containing protein [Mesorhizobium sp.]
MWILSNETPFAAQESWTRDERGHEIWLVAIKASFEIDPDGKQRLLKDQTPVNLAPVYGSDPNELLDETDLNLEKKHTDILVDGHVYAPGGRPGIESAARIKVGDVDKTIKVMGDRVFMPGTVSVRMSRPEPFTKMPISWRRTYGGTDLEASKPNWDQRNPVGTGFAVDPQRLVSKTGPNFEYPDAPYRDHRSGKPAGFGPVARHWQPRIKYAGTYGGEWEQTRDPLLPRDFSRTFFQCAPEDQQTKEPLVGYELVQLGNFSADGFLQFLLPRITFNITTQFYGLPDQTHGEAPIHTLRLKPDQRQFSIAWMSALPVPYDEERLKQTRVRIRPRSGISPTVAATGVWLGEDDS